MGNKIMIEMVCETALLLPDEIVKYLTRNIWFVSSPEDAWAFTFNGSDIDGQSVVILSDELFNQDKRIIQFTILHEIGHAVSGHRNSMGYTQTHEEIQQQEAEANQFAEKYLFSN